MSKLKSSRRNKAFAYGILLMGCPLFAWGETEVVKDLRISSGGGVGQSTVGYTLDYSLGEPAAGHTLQSSGGELKSGYLAVRLGAGQSLRVVQSQIGKTRSFYQRDMQIGVSPQADMTIDFSDQLDPVSFKAGITGFALLNHLGMPMNESVSLRWTYDPSSKQLVLSPSSAWQGNTLYDIVLNTHLMSLNGYPLEADAHIPFMTALDPHQENVISDRFQKNSVSVTQQGGVSASVGTLALVIPQGALSDYAIVLLNPDPLNGPLQVDPKIIQEATQKAQFAGGAYRSPLCLGEIAAFDLQGNPLSVLSQTAEMSMTYLPDPLIRPQTLSIWTLDQTHHLWVKLPASTAASGRYSMSAPVTRFSVFALMGGAAGSTSDVNVFPNPWRPHGPQAGRGPGKTGNETFGMTFTNLPSECSIQIYSLDLNLVRSLQHSDLGGTLGQEKWDGLTQGGARAASGVYLWRVQSNVDFHTGKLMIIR